MNFEHTEDRRMLADSLNRFIAEQYAFDARDRIAKSQHGFSKEIFQQFAELGVIASMQPFHFDHLISLVSFSRPGFSGSASLWRLLSRCQLSGLSINWGAWDIAAQPTRFAIKYSS